MRYVIREKFFRLGEDSQITDESGRPHYEVDGKVLSLHNTLVMRDVHGQEVATVKRELIALTPTYRIERPGSGAAQVRKHFINLLIWPATAGEKETEPRSQTRQGYHLVDWRRQGMNWWAVSDLDPRELAEFAQLLRKRD